MPKLGETVPISQLTNVQVGASVPLSTLTDGQTQQPPTQPTVSHGGIPLLSKVNDALGNFSQGFAKGEFSTLKSMSDMGQGFASTITRPFIGDAADQTSQEQTDSAAINSALKPTGTAENVGFGVEKLAEYLIPAAKAAKAEMLVNTLSSKIPNAALAAGTRITGKGLIQGIAAGGINLLQTADPKSALKTGLEAAAARGVVATIGEGARAINLPERLYSMIFKNTASDMMQELRTETIANLAKDNPEKYAQFVKQGIITEGANGPVLNETIAKQALDSGLRGSIRNMSRTVITGALDSEQQAQSIAASHPTPVPLGDKNAMHFYNLLVDISKEYQDVGFNEISDEAARLAKTISTNDGNISAEDVLSVRRLFDRARIASSFDKPASKLSLGQQNLKTMSDAARKIVNGIPGMKPVMEKYTFYLDAMDSLAKEAARRGNNQALSLIDSMFLSGAFGGNNMLPGVTAGTLRKLLISGPGTTGLAQLLNKGVASPATSAITGAASSLMTAQLPQ